MNEKVLDNNLLDKATEWFVLMRTDELSEQRSADFVRWISQSLKHQAAYVEIGGLWDDLSVLDNEAGLRGTSATVTYLSDHKARAAAVRDPADQMERKNWSFRSIAASVAFLAISMLAYSTSDFLLMDRHSTQTGELADIILEDGSHLVLNTNSEIRVDLQDNRRVVYLERGEVFFEVTRDKNRPFFVETAGGLVRVLGTKFNIRQKNGTSDVTVLEGAVGVVDYGRISDDFATISLDATLAPDQKFTLGNDAVENMAVPVDSTAIISWRDRKLIYNGESFANLIEDINRYYDVEIRIGDPALNDIEVVAILKIEDRAATLKALETTFNVTARPVSKYLIYLYPNE